MLALCIYKSPIARLCAGIVLTCGGIETAVSISIIETKYIYPVLGRERAGPDLRNGTGPIPVRGVGIVVVSDLFARGRPTDGGRITE